MSLSELNIYLFRLINDLGKQHTYLNDFMAIIAEYLLYFFIISLIILVFVKRNRIIAVCSLVTIIVAELIGKLAGKLHTNNQPFFELPNVNQLIEVPVNNSFPSDHTIIVFSICISYFLFRKGWGTFFVLLAILVGISRIWVGVHYPADVLVAALISTIVAIITYLTVPKINFVQKLNKFSEKDGNMLGVRGD